MWKRVGAKIKSRNGDRVTDSDSGAFGIGNFNLPGDRPGKDDIEVILEIRESIWVGENSVEFDIISKEFDRKIWKKVSDVVYIDVEEKGAKNATLRDPAGDGDRRRDRRAYFDGLETKGEEVLNEKE